jgi:hypothetical protein
LENSLSYYYSAIERLIMFLFLFFSVLPETEAAYSYSYPGLPITDTIVIQQKDTTITYIPIHQNKSKADTGNIDKKDPIVEFFHKSASKRQINKWLYDLLINEHKPSKKNKTSPSKDFDKLKNKRINNIYFKRLPPFGSSVKDTTRTEDTWFAKIGNNTRIPTSTIILGNNISLKEGDYVTKKKIDESERLLRQLGYISDAKILVRVNEADTNMVDILVISKDQFPHAFDAGLTHNYPQIKLYSLNLFGQGVGFSQSYTFTPKDDPEHGFSTGIKIKNVYGSLVDINSLYTNKNIRREVYINANRSFYRFETKTAGGLRINRSFKNYGISGSGQIYLDMPLDYLISDLWIGHAFTISSNNYFDKSNLYVAIQNINSDFFDIEDSLKVYPFFEKNHYYFASVTLAKRNYFKNNLVYSFGRTEDVPFGFMLSLTGGFNNNKVQRRPYMGVSFSLGKTIVPNIGYLALSVDATSFLKNGELDQGTLRLTGTFISRLMQAKCCKIRSFINFTYLKGINRLPFEYTYLKESKQGITGLSNTLLRGKEKFVIKTENVYFKKRRFWGFQFAFFSFTDVGFIGNGKSMIFNNRAYITFGGGLRIRNDNLVFKTIQIRFAYMPNLPPDITPYSIDMRGETTGNFKDFYPEIPFKPTFY